MIARRGSGADAVRCAQENAPVNRALKTAMTAPRVGALLVSAAVVAAAAGPASAALSARTYSGKTSQRHSVSLVLSKATITRFSIYWNARCTKGLYIDGLKTVSSNVTLSRQGVWRAAGHYTKPSGNGYIERFTVTGSGTVTKTGARGTFAGTVQLYKRSLGGPHVASCHSGKVTFRLKPAR